MRVKKRRSENEVVPPGARKRGSTPAGVKVKEGSNRSWVEADRQTVGGPSRTERSGRVPPTYLPGPGSLDVWNSWRQGPPCSPRNGSQGMRRNGGCFHLTITSTVPSVSSRGGPHSGLWGGTLRHYGGSRLRSSVSFSGSLQVCPDGRRTLVWTRWGAV